MGKADNSILRSTGIMTMATLLSRATGLLRTWTMAFALGNTLITSAYQVANSMPNVIFDLVAGGILGTAFLPVYLLQKERFGQKGADGFASNVLNISLVALGVLAILSTIFASPVITTQTFTRTDGALVHETAVFFFRIFAVQLVFYGLGGVITGILNANRVYGVPALAPVLNNVVVSLSMFLYVPLSAVNEQLALVVVAVGTTLGVVAQFGMQIPKLLSIGFRYRFAIDLKDPALKEALRIAVPTLIYIAGTLVSFSCRTAFSLVTGDNGPAALSYAWVWYQLPYGVVAVSLSTAFLTEMSAAVSRRDFDGLRDYVRRGMRGTLFLIIPLAGMLFVLGSPFIQLFRAGAFSEKDVFLISDILSAWALSLPFYAGQMYLYRVFAALRQFMAFALVSCGLCVVQVGLYAILCPAMGLSGVPIADFIYYGLMLVTMATILQRRIGSYGIMGMAVMCVKVIVATVIGVSLIIFVYGFIPYDPSMLNGLLRIIFCGGLGLAVIFGICKLLRVPEMDLVTGIVKGLVGRVTGRRRGAGAADSGQHREDPRLAGRQESGGPSRAHEAGQVPAGKHARQAGGGARQGGSGPLEEDRFLEDDAGWNKVGKHAAPPGSRPGQRPAGRHAAPKGPH